MTPIKINGIRLGPPVFHMVQADGGRLGTPPLYQLLALEKINTPCLVLAGQGRDRTVSCCLEGRLREFPDRLEACTVSVFPHHSDLSILGRLLVLFDTLPFVQMASSSAMLTFVIPWGRRKQVLAALENAFDLPPTHTPFESNFHEQTAEFVKERYQETRAFYQEQRIKTYGFKVDKGGYLLSLAMDMVRIADLGNHLTGLDRGRGNLLFAGAFCRNHAQGPGCFELHCFTRERFEVPVQGSGIPKWQPADLVTFHGPHFGDRFGIFNTAMACLDSGGPPLLAAGCAGASVSMVFGAGQGKAALPALEKGFDTP